MQTAQEPIQRMLKGIEIFESLMQALKEDTNRISGSGDFLAIIQHFHAVGILYDTLSDMKKGINAVYDDLSQKVVPEAMREQTPPVKTITIEGIGRVTVSNRWACSILDKPLGFEWLRGHNMGDIIQESVNAQTMASTARNYVEEHGRDLPPEIFKVSINPYTSITKVKSKG